MSECRVGVCAWCGETFQARARGPIPTYCRRSHRQRAHEARQQNPRPPTVQTVDVTMTELVARLDTLVASTPSLSRPTELAATLTDTLDTIEAILTTVRYQRGNLTETHRFIAAATIIGPYEQARQTLTGHARSANRLASAWASTRDVAHHLLNPTPPKPATRGTGAIPVVIPPPGNLYPDGYFDISLERGRRIARWEPADPTDRRRELHEVTGRLTRPHRYETAAHWEHLARDIIAVATGWTNTPIPLPSPITDHATTVFASQLRQQFRTGEWTIAAAGVREWLTRHNWITIRNMSL